MNTISNQGNIASTAGLGFNNPQASSTGRPVFENDKYSFSTQGTQDVTLQNRHSGQTHHASGDFGQSQLDGCRHDHRGEGNGPIDQIVKKVIEAVCKALGIDPSEIFGEQPPQEGQPPSNGCKPGNDSWAHPAVQPDYGPILYTFGENGPVANPGTANAAAPQDDRPTGPIPDPLNLGSAQNQRDHDPIELALDPLGIF